MENQNENLTPDELIEKLKEKLAIDRDAYSKIVEQTEEQKETDVEDIEGASEIEELEEVEEFSEDETDDILYSDEDDDIVVNADIVSPHKEPSYDYDEDEYEGAIVASTIPVSVETGSVAKEQSKAELSDKHTDIPEEDEVDPRILQMLKELEADDCVIEEEKDDKDATVAFGAVKQAEDDATSVFGAVGGEAKSDEGVAKRPTVYHFRRSSSDDEQTKLHDAVSASDADFDDMEQTRLNDVPELKKPDLVVMQTFGATVEHVRSLYGDDVADEYERMIANSDFTERQAAEYEYTTSTQKNEIFHDFKVKMQKSKIKIAVSAVLCLLMLVLENISLFGIELGGMLNSSVYPVSYIMIDLQLLLICAVFAFPVLKGGVSDIFMLEPTSKSAAASVFAVAVVVDIVSCFVGGTVVLYNFAAGLALLFSMVYDVIILKRDYMSFKILSSEKVKNAAIVGVGTSKNEEVSAFEALDDDEEVKVVNLQRGRFIKSFFARTKQTDSSPQDKIILPLAFAAMIVMFVISLLTGNGVSVALKIANMSFSAFVPFAVYFSLSYPVNKAAVSVYENGAAIIGNAALEEYSGSSIICFEDRDVFPSYCVKLKSVKVYGNARIDRVLYNTSSVFSKVGGPLCDVFSLSTVESGSSGDVELVRAETDGIEATVDGQRILVGLPTFMLEYGINVRVDENDPDDVSRLYVAEGEELCAKFYIKYNLDVDFENVITRMTACGICAVLKTFDPNINDTMLSSFIDTTKYPIKVIKGKIGEDFCDIQDELDSGIVSTGGAKSTVDATVTCERLYNIRSSANNVKIVSLVIGVILSAFMAAFGVSPFASIIVVLYQLLWMIPAVISGKLYL